MKFCGDAVGTDVWREGGVPADWSDAVLIPIPKKWDLSHCDNWRGIILTNVVGKVVARVIQRKLQKLVEDELPESQCCFRKSRGYWCYLCIKEL